jgi:hypothetical protein
MEQQFTLFEMENFIGSTIFLTIYINPIGQVNLFPYITVAEFFYFIEMVQPF